MLTSQVNKSEMNLVELPVEVFRLIHSFSTHDDYHYLLNSCRKDLAEVKRSTIYFALNKTKSVDYVNDSDGFRGLLLSNVENGWKQVGLKLIIDSNTKIDRGIPVHTLKNPSPYLKWHSMTNFTHIECLIGVAFEETSSDLSKVKSLTVANSSGFTDSGMLSHLSELQIYCLALSDVSSLKNIPTLSFIRCSAITDFSVFSGRFEKRLHISYAPNLTNVLTFGGIHRVSLDNCNQLEDLTGLRGVYDLKISSCYKVKDLSPLGNHHRLSIESCAYNLAGYSSLLHIPHVRLDACNIVDLSVLRYAKSVALLQSSEVVDVTPLECVQSVTIDYCYRITNIECLSHIPELKIVYQGDKFPNLKTLANKKLFIHGNVAEENFRFSPAIQDLSVSQCDGLTGIIEAGRANHFQHLQYLTIGNSNILTHATGLGNIPSVAFVYCFRLQDISDLGRNRSVELHCCDFVEDVSSLANVPIVTIRYCTQITDTSSLSKVPRLKIVTY